METNILKIINESQDLVRNIDGLTGSDAFEEVIKVFFTINFSKNTDFIDINNFRELYHNKVYKTYDFFIGDTIKLKDLSLCELLNLFGKIDLKSEDVKGRLFEGYLGRVFTSGLGQFFTPREIVEFMGGFLKKHGLINENDIILDPACGSSGILINTQTGSQKIIGYDVNERLVRVSKMNMVIHGITNFEINNQSFLDDNKLKNVDVVITNPPFGVDEKQIDILNKFKFGINRKQRELEILFVEKIVNILKPGGVCAIVLPDGFFNNVSLKDEREFLLENCDIIATIDLPENVFKSTGTGCETGILIFRKKIDKTIPTPEFTAYKVDYVGYETQTKFAKKIDSNDLITILNKSTYKKMVIVKSLNKSKRIDGKFYYRKSITNETPNLNLFIKSGEMVNKKYNKNDIIRYVQYSDIDPVFGLIKSYTEYEVNEAPSRAKIVVKTNDILIPKLKQSSDKICLVTEEYNGCVVTNGFYVVRAIDTKDTNYLFGVLRKGFIQEQIKDFSSGTIMPSIDDNHFEELKYNGDSVEEIKKIDVSITKVFELIKTAKEIIDNIK
jgi:type I restriction-modification system DNA methylase subunit